MALMDLSPYGCEPSVAAQKINKNTKYHRMQVTEDLF